MNPLPPDDAAIIEPIRMPRLLATLVAKMRQVELESIETSSIRNGVQQ
jgi:hypothetical protein